tara:strand:- start:277 stop:948 length:672 start_codon:yes stop_codon:yes gene_type:complete
MKITKYLALISSGILMLGNAALAGGSIGVTGTLAMISADGSETEGTAADTSTKSASVDNLAAYGSIFVEGNLDNGMVVGFSHNPFSADVSDATHTRSDTSVAGSGEGVTGTNTRSADAEVSNYNQLYVEIPTSTAAYVKLGAAQIDVNTKENALTNGGTYGDATLDGFVIGIGTKADLDNGGFFKVSAEYVDFEELKLNSSTNNSIKADLDVIELNFSIGKSF